MANRSIQTSPNPESPVKDHQCEKCFIKDQEIESLEKQNEKLMEEVSTLLKK
jgi:hypothetical protein